MRLRRFIPLVAAIGAAASMLLATPALAAGSHTAPATRSAKVNAELKAEIKAQLRYNPSGKVINARQVSYDHGHVVVTVVIPGDNTPDFTCPDGFVCLFERPNLKGNNAAINEPRDRDIRIAGYLPFVQSLHNLRSTGSILSNGVNRSVCYTSGQRANAISDPVMSYPYLFLQANDNC